MILKLSCIVVLHEDDLFFSYYLISDSWIHWKEEFHDQESILWIISDEVFCDESIGTHSDDHLFCCRIHNLISTNSFLIKEIIELMGSFDRHLRFQTWIFTRRTILIVFIAGRDEVTILSPDSNIR